VKAGQTWQAAAVRLALSSNARVPWRQTARARLSETTNMALRGGYLGGFHGFPLYYVASKPVYPDGGAWTACPRVLYQALRWNTRYLNLPQAPVVYRSAPAAKDSHPRRNRRRAAAGAGAACMPTALGGRVSGGDIQRERVAPGGLVGGAEGCNLAAASPLRIKAAPLFYPGVISLSSVGIRGAPLFTLALAGVRLQRLPFLVFLALGAGAGGE